MARGCRTAWWVGVVCAVASGCLPLADADVCRPSAALGRDTVAAATPAVPTISVATFNLYDSLHDRQVRTRRAMEIVEALHPDVMLLQEVAEWPKDAYRISDCWGTRFGLRSFLFMSDRGWFSSTGEAMLSRFAIREAAGHRFRDTTLFGRAGYLQSIVETPWGDLAVLGVHMAAVRGGAVKRAEFGELQRLAVRLAQHMPVVIAGDFNEDHSAGPFAAMIAALGAEDLHAIVPPQGSLRSWAGRYGGSCAGRQAELLDYILYVPSRDDAAPRWHLIGGGIYPDKPPYASDHCPVAGLLRLVPGVQSPGGAALPREQ
jgi:endonuclease/exonuclease/phosphatase family metal-dependent hydrolase